MTKNYYLFEILCQPIPSKMQNRAKDQLMEFVKKFFINDLSKNVLFNTACTSNRMNIYAENLPSTMLKKIESIKGPKTDVSTEILDKFLNKISKQYKIDTDILSKSLIKDKDYWYINKFEIEISIEDILLSMQADIMQNFYWPKTMIYLNTDNKYIDNTEQKTIKWIRPISNIISMLNNKVLDFSFFHYKANNKCFLNYNQVELLNHAKDYLPLLAKNKIEISNEIKKQILIDALQNKALNQLTYQENDALLEEIACSTETMHVFFCKPDIKNTALENILLKLPNRFIETCVQEHQQAICLKNTQDKIIEFMLVSQKPATEQMIQDVLSVMQYRLEDLLFMYENDINNFTESTIWKNKLQYIEIYTNLGNILEKTKRIANLFQTHINKLTNIDIDLSSLIETVDLYKLDLCSQVVQEFPSLHGFHMMELLNITQKPKSIKIIDAYLKIHDQACLEGLLLGFFDRIDSLVGFFRLNITINSSQDPLGLRKLAAEIIQYGLNINQTISLSDIKTLVKLVYKNQTNQNIEIELLSKIINFIDDRMQFFLKNKYCADKKFNENSVNTEELSIFQTQYINNFWLQDYKTNTLNALKENSINNYDLLFNTYKRLSNFIKNKSIEKDIEHFSTCTDIATDKIKSFILTINNTNIEQYLNQLIDLSYLLQEFFNNNLVLDPNLSTNFLEYRLILLQKCKEIFDQYIDFSHG